MSKLGGRAKKIFGAPKPDLMATLLQTLWQYSDGDFPNGAPNAGGVSKNRDFRRISGLAIGSMTEVNYNTRTS